MDIKMVVDNAVTHKQAEEEKKKSKNYAIILAHDQDF